MWATILAVALVVVMVAVLLVSPIGTKPVAAGMTCSNSYHTHDLGLTEHWVYSYYPYGSMWKWHWWHYNWGGSYYLGSVLCNGPI
jgi:hypothetical protein